MAWNDNGGNPWQRNARQGPPDLDDLFGKLFRRLFGSGRRGGGGGSGRKWSVGTGSILLVLLILWLLSGFYIVEASERGVVLRFGKHDRTTMPGPGWHIIVIFNLIQETGTWRMER